MSGCNWSSPQVGTNSHTVDHGIQNISAWPRSEWVFGVHAPCIESERSLLVAAEKDSGVCRGPAVWMRDGHVTSSIGYMPLNKRKMPWRSRFRALDSSIERPRTYQPIAENIPQVIQYSIFSTLAKVNVEEHRKECHTLLLFCAESGVCTLMVETSDALFLKKKIDCFQKMELAVP